jgi:Glycosyl hydrolase family 95 catalytic domain
MFPALRPRTLLLVTFWLACCWLAPIHAADVTALDRAPALVGILPNSPASELFRVDYRALVSRADLDYTAPATRSEEGMPVGNGRMGSLVWTTPTQLKFQINHANVYGINRQTDSFPTRHSDYATSCGYVDISFVDYGNDVFAGDDFHQHLALYDGLLTAAGRGVTARIIGWPRRDVLAIEIDDTREHPSPISIDLRMLRYAIQYHAGENWELTEHHQVKFQTASHTATSGLEIRGDRIALVQQFTEDDFYGASALVAGVSGRAAQPRYENDATVRLTAAPGRGKFTILLAAAASFDRDRDVAADALAELKAAAELGFQRLQDETARHWRDFWSRGFVHLQSADGQADFLEQQYTYFLYLMAASSSGGDYPPRFGGMLWYTSGDLRAWGSQHWWANTSAYYSNLMPSGRLELMDPMFDMYSRMAPSCSRAAQQQWGSQGIWIPETVWFDGLEELPDDIAAEMQQLYLTRQPWSAASPEFLAWASSKQPHNSRTNWKSAGHWDNGHWIYTDKGTGPFGHTTHILGAGARIAALFWQRYQYAQDVNWLRERAYPMIRGAAEFYRNFPNFQRGDDGRFHLLHVNNSESNWNSADSPYEVECMNFIFPLAVRASEILNVDAELRPAWQEIADHLPPRPRERGRRGFGAFVYGGPGEIEPLGADRELKRRFLTFTRLGNFIDERGIGGAQIFRNRLRLREGPGAIDAEHIAGLNGGIQSSLLDSAPPSEAEEPVLRLFSAWPADWNAEFELLARGAFVVGSAIQDGQIPLVEIHSQAGRPCQLQSPWPNAEVNLWRNGQLAESLKGNLLNFSTSAGETIVLAPKGVQPKPIDVTPMPSD